MVHQGLVLLSDADVDAPDLPAVATVSKDDQADGGAYFIGAAAAAEGALWVDRPYWTGVPDVAWVVGKCDRVTDAGGYVQCGNEQNLELEGFSGGPGDWLAFEAEVRTWADRPDRVLSMPPSPGMPNWQDWVGHEGPFACHAYGSSAQMQEVVRWYLENRTGDVYVTEMNPGAGNTFDLDAWARTEMVDFLDWCAGEPRVRAACYFAWRWDQSPSLPSSVDARGTEVERVLLEWTPPMNGGADEEWYPLAARCPISTNYTPGRGGSFPVAVVCHIADGYGSPFGWFDTDRGESGSSAHFWVSRTGVVEQYLPLADTAWANGPLCDPDMANPTVAWIVGAGVDPNAVTVAIEHEGVPGETLPRAQVDASAALVAWLADRYDVPRDRDGVLGHYQFDFCTRANCPGPTFPWTEVLTGEQGAPVDIAALRDQVWALADQAEQAGYPWYGQALKSATALSKGEA